MTTQKELIGILSDHDYRTVTNTLGSITDLTIEYIFYHEPANYNRIWELPFITDYNKDIGIMAKQFWTLYQHKDIKSQYIFIAGRIGNTSDWLILGIGE